MSKRETISNGYRWIRFLIFPVAFVLISNIINTDINRWRNVVFLMISIGLYVLLKRLRRLNYDDENLYVIHGKKEKAIHYATIVSIKRSSTKVNGSRYWILRYNDENNKTHKIRYFLSFFYSDFHKKVRLINPDVVIWTHPHFNH